MKIDIKPLKFNQNIKLPPDTTPKWLPHRFFFTPIFGNRNVGKSVLITNMLYQGLKDVYKYIYVFSPTCKYDLTYQSIKNLPNVYLCDEPSPEFITHIFKHHEGIYKRYLKHLENKQKNKKEFDIFDNNTDEFKQPPFTLMIFDDLSQDYKKYSKILARLSYTARHVGISCLLTSHQIRVLPPSCRSQSTQFIIFRIPDFEKQKWLYENSDLMNVKDLEKLLNYATSIPYQFLYYDGKKFSIGFET